MNSWPSHIELLTPGIINNFQKGMYNEFAGLIKLASEQGQIEEIAGIDASKLMNTLAAEWAFAMEVVDVPIYAVDVTQVSNALWSGIHEEIPFPSMPPLPFEKIVIESMTEMTWNFNLPEGKHILIDAMMVEEIERGEIWNVLYLTRVGGDRLHPETGDPVRFAIRMRIKADATFQVFGLDGNPGEINQNEFAPFLRLPVEAVHYITAKEAEHLPLPRAVRRRFQRETGKPHPPAWQIRIGSRTGTKSEISGSGRKITCRFLVQGHWMRCIEGHTYRQKPIYIPHKGGDCIWRETFVKGSPDLPWRAPRHPVRLVD